jgi:hypothetical protein
MRLHCSKLYLQSHGSRTASHTLASIAELPDACDQSHLGRVSVKPPSRSNSRTRSRLKTAAEMTLPSHRSAMSEICQVSQLSTSGPIGTA